jgi:hypothetical protein
VRRLLNVLPARTYLQLKWQYAKLFDRREFDALQQLRRVTTPGLASLRDFDKKKAIFIHIPKCAGIAVKKALFSDIATAHTKLSAYCRVFEPDLFLAYFKFTFVRNPWDRLVSAYHFLKGGGYGEGDKRWFERELATYEDFDDFVRNWLKPKNIHRHIHFCPQVEFLRDENHDGVGIDYVGFYENIEKDFDYIARRIGVGNSLKRENVSAHKSYKDYYNETTRNIVRQVYLQDIEQFGYDFENTNLPQQIANRDAALRKTAAD